MFNIPLLYIYNFVFLFVTLILCELKIIPKKLYLYISAFYFLFIFGQRWYGGVDFPFYLEGYLINNKRFESGYFFFQNLFQKNNIYFGNLIFIIYAFTTITSVWFIRKYVYSNYMIFLFFLTEYHIMSINPLRTYIAINFFLIGYYFFNIKDKKVGIFIMGIGIFFHKLAIGAILIFFLSKIINLKKYEKFVLIFLLIIPLVDVKFLLEKITSFVLPQYLCYFGGYFDKKLSLLNIFRYYTILVLFIYLRKGIDLKDIKEKKLLESAYLFFILIGTATNFAPLHRIAYFYKIFEFLFFAYIFDFKRIGNLKRFLIISVFIINYIAIGYKDMGVLFEYELRPLQFFNTKSSNEYIKENERYLKKYKDKFI